MYMSNLPIQAIMAASLISLSHAAFNNQRPYVISDSVGAQTDIDVTGELPSHNNRSVAWDVNYIPKYCYNEARTYNLNPADFEVRNVYYIDCSASWAICRYKGASKSWSNVIDWIGKLPVGMRQYIANIMILPDNINTCAYTWTGEWMSSSYVSGCFTVGVLAHETNHILDVAALPEVIAGDGLSSGTAYSSTSHWSGAYNKDTAVVTSYANTNWAEDFADTGRMALSDYVHPGGLAGYGVQTSKVANQLGNYRTRLYSKIFPSGNRCTGKVPTTQAVQKSNGQPGSRRIVRGVPGSGGLEGVPEIKIAKNVPAEQFVYTGPVPAAI